MSQAADVYYSCGSCGYPLNLKSSNRITSGIGYNYRSSIRKGYISFARIDFSRFTQLDNVNCLPISSRLCRSKTKLLCRNCGVLIGHGYLDMPTICGIYLSAPSSSSVRKYVVKIRALQPYENDYGES